MAKAGGQKKEKEKEKDAGQRQKRQEAEPMDAKAYVHWRLASTKGEKGVRQLRSELVARRDELADKLGVEVHARASAFGEAARMAPKLEDVLAGARAGLERASTAAGFFLSVVSWIISSVI